MTYHVYGGVRSRAFRVLWALEELGQSYEQTASAPRAPEVVALNPSGKVPVLVADGTALTDSTAIVTYLADKHGQITFPAGSLERAKQDGFTQMALDELDGTLWTASRHSFVLPEEMRVPEVKPSLKWEFAQSCARIAAGFEGPFLMGETFTVADIVFGHCLGWASVAKFSHDQPVLQDYLSRLRARPAYQAARSKES
ncbi:glutathione S-transferase family protein [Flavimaricola marinus]|uniref:Glutathione S-transferase n=1 Tax=Flavimaricola marinus TaxID=1819565 RepID=A0A238LF39_9RHOB|nr:glutathione S-transferase family protein [Flavimaricola marinus]SMY08327.1 Glutathione S-transferase [Flavimaricola marinus]